jgi:hypothetical protein
MLLARGTHTVTSRADHSLGWNESFRGSVMTL